MASKKFQDGIPSAEGVKYQLVTGSDNKTSITNTTAWTQEPTELRANDIIQGMVLECDHIKTGAVHVLTNPNITVRTIRFKLAADSLIEDGDTFTFNGADLNVIGEVPTNLVDGETVFAVIEGSTINFKKGGAGGAAQVYPVVVGGAARPENPHEGTIWMQDAVVTGEPWVADAPPSSPVQGQVWVPIKAGTNYQVQATENATYYVPVDVPKWYTGGGWTSPDTQIYLNDEWVDMLALPKDGLIIHYPLAGDAINAVDGVEAPTSTLQFANDATAGVVSDHTSAARWLVTSDYDITGSSGSFLFAMKRTAANGGGMNAAAYGPASSYGFSTGISTDTHMTLQLNGTSSLGGTMPVDSKWHVYGVTYAPGAVKFFKDGVFVVARATTLQASTSTYFAMGALTVQTNGMTGMYMSNYIHYNRTLADEEMIQASSYVMSLIGT